MALNVQQENVVLSMRIWSLQICELGAELARQAGDEVHRPLSEPQIKRALDAHRQEHSVCMAWLLDAWDGIEKEAQTPQPMKNHESPNLPGQRNGNGAVR